MRDTININYIIGILKISCVMVAGLACFWLFWCHHNHMCVCVCFVCTQMHSCISLTPITKFKTNIYTRILHIHTHTVQRTFPHVEDGSLTVIVKRLYIHICVCVYVFNPDLSDSRGAIVRKVGSAKVNNGVFLDFNNRAGTK